MGRRRAMYRQGWLRIKDLKEWDRPPGQTWFPKTVLKEFGRRGGQGIFCQTQVKGVVRNYWIRTWAVHVVFEQIEAFSLAKGDVSVTQQDAENVLAAGVGNLQLHAEHLDTIPEEWRRPDAIVDWLSFAKGRSIAGAWGEEWFRAWEDLPPWTEAPP